MSTAVQRSRRRQAREETRAQILAAADAFLRDRPFRELSVDALMTQTGHTRTVFYRHFDDLADLVLSVLQAAGRGRLIQIAEAWASDPTDDEASARRALEQIVALFAEHGPLIRAVVDAASYDEAIEGVYRSFFDRFVELTEQAISERIETGRLVPIDAHEVARALTIMNARYLVESFGREPKADPARALEAVWLIWTRTLYSDAARP